MNDDALTATREALHAVAEHVLAADLHRSNGHIGLRATPGGFGTPMVDTPGGARRARVEGTELVLELGDDVKRMPLTTLGEAAAFLDVPLGAPEGLYAIATAKDADAPLAIDPAAAARVHDLFRLTDEALRWFAAEVAPDDPPVAQLWPEHFDLALSFDEVNYGGSPGDGGHPEPYLYVGPWELTQGPYWNEPFGASVSASEVEAVDDAVAFFRTGRQAAN
ncbi:MAG TPA: hypothetical protein VGM93_08220 [Acidimicrobiales bacterium]